MSWIEKKVYSLEKIINYIYCKVKNLTNIHNELNGLQGSQKGEYYHQPFEVQSYIIYSATDQYEDEITSIRA